MGNLINENTQIEIDEENGIITLTNEKNGNVYINTIYLKQKNAKDEENEEK